MREAAEYFRRERPASIGALRRAVELKPSYAEAHRCEALASVPHFEALMHAPSPDPAGAPRHPP